MAEGANVTDLKNLLINQFPDFQKLASLRVAVNTEYADDSTTLRSNDEIVLIPPVSGG
ncbi:MAG: MoaD/ThiS family protein [Runella slithyformis]|nr:MAG: MoaD/ThiS family protein [Runella slithyformis]